MIMDLDVHQGIINSNLGDAKKDLGVFFTPECIVDLMVRMIDAGRYGQQNSITILEPACGLTQFLIGIKRNKPDLFSKAELYGVEINKEIVKQFKSLNLINDNVHMVNTDYLLWQPDKSFDLIIGNPPYGIPSLSEHYTIKVDSETKKRYKAAFETWYGKYNVYGAFIEKSIKLLKPEGQLILIIPATFMILDDFKKLRFFLSQNGVTNITYLGPHVFKPEANVAAAVLNFHKSRNCGYLALFDYRENTSHIMKEDPDWKGEVVKFETDYTRRLEAICSHKLGDIFDIRISPRTPEIKNNRFIAIEYQKETMQHLPILNGRNLKCNNISYEALTGFWIESDNVEKLRRFFKIPHIVVGLGFRENGRVASAYDDRCYPWMGDVYHLLNKNDMFSSDFDLNTADILEYLNSDYVRKYVKETYREITYHLSITQLKNIPCPTNSEWNEIKDGAIHEKFS